METTKNQVNIEDFYANWIVWYRDIEEISVFAEYEYSAKDDVLHGTLRVMDKGNVTEIPLKTVEKPDKTMRLDTLLPISNPYKNRATLEYMDAKFEWGGKRFSLENKGETFRVYCDGCPSWRLDNDEMPNYMGNFILDTIEDVEDFILCIMNDVEESELED